MTAPGTPPEPDEPDDDQGSDDTTLLDKLRAALLDTDDLDSIPEPESLITGLLFRNSLAWIMGKSGDGKSFVALDMAGCIATGQPWHDHGVTTVKVLYVVAEGATGIRKRVRAWEESYGRKMTGVQWLPVAVQAGRPADWRALIRLAVEIGADLIIIDTQARVTVGLEENSAKDMGEFVDQLERLRIATRACVAVVHHMGHNGDHMRGSTALYGSADTEIKVTKDGSIVTLKNSKQKNFEEHEDIQLRLTPLDGSAILTLLGEDATADREAALRTAVAWWKVFEDERVSATKLLDAAVAAKTTFYRHVRVLLDIGNADKEEAGRNTYYRLTRDPQSDIGTQ